MSRAAIIASVAAAAWLALLIVAPRAAAGGWLTAFVAAGAAPFGALAWRLIGRLTGGVWADTAALTALSETTPFVLLAAILLLVFAPLIYPWAVAPTPLGAYLSPLGFGLRALLALGGLTAIALLLRRMQTRLFAGLALLFYGATIGLMATDWLFSLHPAIISSNGGMALAVQQLGTALAAALLLGVEDERRRRDLMGLLIACLLGALYLDLMAYIVVWYGDQADKTIFYRLRATEPWPFFMAVIVGAGRLAPIGLIALHQRLDQSGRAAAALALIGFWLETAWMVAPDARLLNLASAALAVVGSVAGFLAWRAHRPEARRLAHG